jgi:hypothetical protein
MVDMRRWEPNYESENTETLCSDINIMKGLFEMVHDRARLDGAPIMITSGIPSYC